MQKSCVIACVYQGRGGIHLEAKIEPAR